MIRLGYTILYVSDVSLSIAFYEAAFGFVRRFVTPENDYGELSTGETILAFASKPLAGSNLSGGFLESDLRQKPFGMELGLVTEDVAAATAAALRAGAVLAEAPKEKPWGQVVAYVRDIDGFLIELCTPIG